MQWCQLILLACLLPAVATADDNIISPESIEGVTIVDAEGLIEKVASTPELVLIDARIPADRSEGYIEGSVALPDIDTNCHSLHALVPDHTTPVMFYCNGIKCGRSATSAEIARDCNYRHLFWFRNGMEGWQAKQYPLVQ